MRHAIGLMLLVGCTQVPVASDLASLEGVWESPGGFEYASMVIKRTGEIAWESGGCLAQASGLSKGGYRDDKLVLSPPMEMYGGDQLSVFHLVRCDGREYLVAAEHLELVREDTAPFEHGFWWGLRRRLPRTTLEQRFSTSSDGEERERLLEEWASWPIDMAGIRFLVRVAHSDLNEDVRRQALVALESAGQDQYGVVTDQAVHDAAQAALGRMAVQND